MPHVPILGRGPAPNLGRGPAKVFQTTSTPWRIFWAAFLLRVAVIAIGHTYRITPLGDHFHFGFEMGRIARSLVRGQGYANPFNGVSGPTAWVPPLYPLLIALAFKLFGVYTAASAFFLLTINSLFSAAICPAIYELAARCFDRHQIARRNATTSNPIALWSAWLWALYPAALQYAIHWLWEMSLSTCLFTWALVFALRLRKTSSSEPNPYKTWALFGLFWGLTALSNASLLICFPAMLFWILWRRDLHTAAAALLAVAVIAAVVSPWIIRNERALHAFVPTRSNFGVELDESLKPEHDAFPYGTALPLWPGDPEFQLYVRLGEVPYAKLRGQQGKARLRANPRAFLHHTIDRFFFFWNGTPHPPDRHPAQEYLRQLSYSFLSLAGLLGLLLALRRRVPGAALFGCMFLLLPLPYYLITVQPRFRHPLEPLIAILAVYLFRSTQNASKQPASTAMPGGSKL